MKKDGRNRVQHIEVTGKRYNHIVAIELLKEKKGKHIMYLCLCDCGKRFITTYNSLVMGRFSCGCIRKMKMPIKEYFVTKHPLYWLWCSMKDRCYNKLSLSYPDYGGRGIFMCDEWRNDFHQFAKDMGDKPHGKYTIDRIDNNKGYSKDNCRWATDTEQANNKRNTIMITYNGVTKSIHQFATEYNIPFGRLAYRISIAKWDVHKSLTYPARKSRKKK